MVDEALLSGRLSLDHLQPDLVTNLNLSCMITLLWCPFYLQFHLLEIRKGQNEKVSNYHNISNNCISGYRRPGSGADSKAVAGYNALVEPAEDHVHVGKVDL